LSNYLRCHKGGVNRGSGGRAGTSREREDHGLLIGSEGHSEAYRHHRLDLKCQLAIEVESSDVARSKGKTTLLRFEN
jgi:hypothetical protein